MMANIYNGMLLGVYQAIVAVMVCFYRLRVRINPNHQYAALYAERLLHCYRHRRPEGILVWLHVASLGEYHGIKPLLSHMLQTKPDIHLLITSSSRNSANFIKANLPDRCQHIMLPFDSQKLIQQFISYWQPQAVVWTESELWPNTLHCIQQHALPLTLVNARLSDRAAQQWTWLKSYIVRLLNCFDWIFVVDQNTFNMLLKFGYSRDRLQLTGSLKRFAAPLPVNINELDQLDQQISGRLVWVAASTHSGEESTVLKAHQQLQFKYPHALLIICPRRPQRGNTLTQQAKQMGFSVAQRNHQQPLQPHTAVYIADTLGELGLWYRLANMAFLGGSLVPVGGHNPYEAIRLNTQVMHGPQVANFADDYAQLKAVGNVYEVTSANDICTLLEQQHKKNSSSQRHLGLTSIAAENTLDKIIATVLKRVIMPQDPLTKEQNQ
jgi:3-deoxy-D-manno-octulosonic-acid transferase